MNKVVFLDRDGTINVDKAYLYQVEDFEYMPDVIEGLKELQTAGFLLIIVTNQSGIGRGFYTEEDYRKLDRWMKEDLEKKGVHIAASYYCPHHPQAMITKYRMECDCRKPCTGMFIKAIADWNIDLSESYAIGDHLRDVAICQNTACRGIVIEAKHKDENELYNVIRVSRFAEAVEYIISKEEKIS